MKNFFHENLTVMAKKKLITQWNDGLIEPGTLWREQIMSKLDSMDIFVGLLTNAFIASDFIDSVEVAAAKKKLEAEGREFLFVLILVDDIPLDAPAGEYFVHISRATVGREALEPVEFECLNHGGHPSNPMPSMLGAGSVKGSAGNHQSAMSSSSMSAVGSLVAGSTRR